MLQQNEFFQPNPNINQHVVPHALANEVSLTVPLVMLMSLFERKVKCIRSITDVSDSLAGI